MPFDSAADLLFNIGANSEEAEENVARFRKLLSTDLDAIGHQFTEWSEGVFGKLDTVKGAMLGITAGLAAAGVAAGAFAVEAAGKFERYAIAVGDAAQKTGLTTQTLSAMHMAADDLDVSFDQVTLGLVRFERGVMQAQDGTSMQARLLAQMGYSTDQVRGAMSNIAPFLEDFGQKFAQLPEGPQKTGVAMEFMGRAGANNIKFMQVWAAQAEEFRKKAQELGLELSPTDVLKAREYQAAVKDLHEQWEAFEMWIGSRAVPILTSLEVGVGGFIEALKAGPMSGLDLVAKWTAGMSSVAGEIQAMAKAANDLGHIKDIPGLGAGAKTKEAAQDLHTLTDRVEEMRLKLAEAAGPEDKLVEEIAQMGLKAGEAAVALNKANAEHKLAPGVYEREAGALADLIGLIGKYHESMKRTLADQDLAALQKYIDGVTSAGQELRDKLDEQQDSTFARQSGKWVEEIDRLRQKMATEQTLTAENEAMLAELKEAGLNRISRAQSEAFTRELETMQGHMAKMVEANLTEREQLAFQY